MSAPTPEPPSGSTRDPLPRAVAINLLGLLLAGAFAVLRPFLISVAWAGVLVSTTWPLYRRVLSRWQGHQGLAAMTMTVLLVLTIFGPAATIAWILAAEAKHVLQHVQLLTQGPPPSLPDWLVRLPIIGERMANLVQLAFQDPTIVKDWIAENRERLSQFAVATIGDVGRNIGKTLVSLLTAYFMYRHGERLIAQARIVIERFAGPRVRALIPTVGTTTKAVVYGILMTALAQGCLAGVGFWFTGVAAPVLLGVTTAFASLIPFGPPFVWLPAALWLLLNGAVVKGVVLLAWGTLVVSTIDNILRPYFISQATRLPVLLIFFGVLGGASAFGLIGLFLGPIVLVILLILWREWAQENVLPTDRP
ncbi:MAG: AI-2E family transporter [Planctomycetota bacterium]